MAANLKSLGEQVRKARQKKALTIPDIVRALGNTDTVDIERLESAEQLPRREVVEALATFLSIPDKHWRPLLAAPSSKRRDSELALEELVGRPVNLDALDSAGAEAADRVLADLLGGNLTSDQAHALFNRLLVFYGVQQTSESFFDHYFGPRAFTSDAKFREAIRRYQIDAIRLFSSFAEAYEKLNRGTVEAMLQPLANRSDESYRARRPWTAITEIEEERPRVHIRGEGEEGSRRANRVSGVPTRTCRED